MPAGLVFGVDLFQQVFDNLFFVALRGRVDPPVAVLQFVALVNQQRHVAAIIDDEFRTLAIGVAERLVSTLPILFERLTLPGEHRHVRGRNGGRGVVLRRENIAAGPANAGAEVDQGFDENRGLNRHVE